VVVIVRPKNFIREFYGDSPSFESVRPQTIREGKKILKEEKEEIDQELLKALRKTADEFMSNLAILGEKRFRLSQAELVLIGGDGSPWIKEGAQNYFPNSVYQLDKFHLQRKIKQTLPFHQKRQKEIRDLLKGEQIDKALEELRKERILKPEHKKDLEELIHYIYANQEGVNAVDRLRKQGIPVEDLGAIEGNIDKSLAHRFQKRGMRWSIPGALNLAKVGQMIVNQEWDSWWPREITPLEPTGMELEKVFSLDFDKEDKYDQTYSLPVLSGPHQDRPWVKSLKKLVSIDY